MAAQNVQHAKRSQDAAGPKDAASGAGRWKGGGMAWQRISKYSSNVAASIVMAKGKGGGAAKREKLFN